MRRSSVSFVGVRFLTVACVTAAFLAVPAVWLGGGVPPRLGWNTWLPAPGLGRRVDAADALFEAEVVEAEELRRPRISAEGAA